MTAVRGAPRSGRCSAGTFALGVYRGGTCGAADSTGCLAFSQPAIPAVIT